MTEKTILRVYTAPDAPGGVVWELNLGSTNVTGISASLEQALECIASVSKGEYSQK